MSANGLNQLVVNSIPGQVGSGGVIAFTPSAMGYFNDAQNVLGYGLPQDMFNLFPDAQPTVDQVQAAHADVQTYGTVISNLQRALFWEYSRLSNAQYASSRRAPYLVHASTRHRQGENRYQLRRTSSSAATPGDKAGIAAGLGSVFVGGGGSLMAFSGVTASTFFTASTFAVSTFTLWFGHFGSWNSSLLRYSLSTRCSTG